jgi:hypothetical protein
VNNLRKVGLLTSWMLLVASVAPGVILRGPEIARLSWGSRSLHAADMDGDGKQDVVLINNTDYKIEVLYQRDPGSRGDAVDEEGDFLFLAHRFLKTDITVSQRLYALTTGDFDGDGRLDLAVTGSRNEVVFLYQDAGGRFDRRRRVDVEHVASWTGTLVSADLNSDGRRDLLIMTETNLLALLQNEDGEPYPSEIGPLPSDRCYGVQLVDMDGDGSRDLLYVDSKSKNGLRVRMGLPGGEFGPERELDVPSPSGNVWPMVEQDGSPFLVMIPENGKMVEKVQLTTRPRRKSEADDVQPKLHSVPLLGPSHARYTLADLDGNGAPEVVIADPDGARLLVCSWIGEDLGPPEPFPAPRGVTSLSHGDLDGDGREEVVLASQQERSVAVTHLTPEGRLAFPRTLPIEGKPLAVACLDADGDGHIDVVVSTEDHHAPALLFFPEGKVGEGPKPIPLEDLREAPESLRVLDIDGDGRLDLLMSAAREPLKVILAGEQGLLLPKALVTAPAGLLSRAETDSLVVMPALRGGKPKLLVPLKGFVRVFELEGETLQAVEQFNAGDPQSVVGGVVMADLDGDGRAEALLIHDDDGKLEILSSGLRGVYRRKSLVGIPELDVLGARVVSVPNAAGHILVFGAKSFLDIPLAGTKVVGRHTEIFESTLNDVDPNMLTVGDLDGDGAMEIVLVDSTRSHVMQVLKRGTGGNWHSVLHFPIFESDPFREADEGGSRQPRELLIADVTGDGREDLLLLIHDKLLIYQG